MSLFKKKQPTDEVPEIPSLPSLPTTDFTLNNVQKPQNDLPPNKGDARDKDNQEAIKSAIDSSEKISGDSAGAVNSPSESLPIPPVVVESPKQPLLPVPPAQKAFPAPPRYESTQPVSLVNTLPEPPVKERPLVNPFVQPEPMPTQPESLLKNEDKAVRKDATESIFVRIDKFHSAKHDVDEIERDLRQITQVIEKITDIKLKEDEEITEINKTLEEIKNRISRIDSEVFNRI